MKTSHRKAKTQILLHFRENKNSRQHIFKSCEKTAYFFLLMKCVKRIEGITDDYKAICCINLYRDRLPLKAGELLFLWHTISQG